MASCWRCRGVCKDEEVGTTSMANMLQSSCVPADPDVFKQLFVDIDRTLEGRGAVKKVPMSKEVETFASHLETHLSEVISTVQVSKEVINALGTLPWVGAGVTIIAMGLNMTLKAHENRERCSDIMKKSLELWEKVMFPVLETRGLASEFMGESTGIIIEGYLYCRNLLNSRPWKRFICASSHERELEMWEKKRVEFLLMANTIMNADTTRNLLPRTPLPPKTSSTITFGLEEQKKDILELLKLQDMEETRVVVLHGMGGVGKSTLAEVVYKQALMSSERRPCRIEVGEKPSKEHITNLQRKMVEDLTGKGLQNMERDKAAIEDELRQVLSGKSGKPVLVFIDNVLKTEDLEEVLNLDCELIEIPKGSRLLVTTRDVSVCNKVFKRNGQFNVKEFSVQLLNDKNARMLFFWHAFGEAEPSMELVERYDDGQGLIKNMVSSICGNLPLALRVLGRSLINMEVPFWRKKYKELNISLDFELKDKVIKVLKSSYDTLDSETKTSFLIACVCFYDISFEHLKDCVTSLLPQASLTRLFELSLLEKFTDKERFMAVRMHDLVRNLGYKLAIDRKCAYPTVLTSKEDFLNIKDEAWSELKWLRVPPLEDGIEAKLLENCKELEIIVLKTRVNGHIGNPPQQLKAVYSNSSVSIEFDKLKELVVWKVDDYLEVIPVTPSTRALQVMYRFQGPHISEEAIECHKNTLRKLRCKQIVELSSYFCEKMSELRCLHLEDYKGESFPKEMGSLVGLEVLTVESATIQEVPQSLGYLKRLQVLGLILKNSKEIPNGVLGGMIELVWLDLTLGRVESMHFMQDIGQLASLEVLALTLPSAKRLMENDGVSLKLEKLRWFWLVSESVSSLEGVCLSCPSLEQLYLSLRELEILPSTFITGATKLRRVMLAECDRLKELSAGTEMLGAVVSLVVWSCPVLKALPEGLMMTVKSLLVGECEGMGRLPADVEEEERARGMRLLLCDSRLLPPHLLPLPPVLPFTPGDGWSTQRVESFVFAEFGFPASRINLVF